MSGPRAKKWPKVNRGLKIVNYFTCMRHFSCRWYRPPEVDSNGYPRICNPYCRDIQIRRCEWTQGKKMTQSKSEIKGSKGKRWWLPTTHLPPHILTICGIICGSKFFLGKKLINIFKSEIKGSKGSVGGYQPHIYHHIFWQYVGQYVGPNFY